MKKPSKTQEIAVSLLMNVVESVGKSKLSDLLESIKEHNTPEVFKRIVVVGHEFAKLLETAAAKTPTKIDDSFVDIVLEPVEDAADAAGIKL